jgi:hypothetical protein
MIPRGKGCLCLLVSSVGLIHLCMLIDAVNCLAAIMGLAMQCLYWNFIVQNGNVDLTLIVEVSGVYETPHFHFVDFHELILD